jgi:hypothetical protein
MSWLKTTNPPPGGRELRNHEHSTERTISLANGTEGIMLIEVSYKGRPTYHGQINVEDARSDWEAIQVARQTAASELGLPLRKIQARVIGPKEGEEYGIKRIGDRDGRC